MTRSPPKSWSTVCSIVALIDAPNVVKRATTAVPTISADALADGAPRVAHRVATGEAAGLAAEQARAEAEHGGGGAGDDRTEDHRADQGRQRAEPGLPERAGRRSSR